MSASRSPVVPQAHRSAGGLEERGTGHAPATEPPASPDERASRAPTLRDETKAMFRQAVLDAAEKIFAAEGVHRARVQDIAKLARVSVGTVYNHFAQKEDIIAALLAERESEILDAVVPRDDDPSDFAGRFRCQIDRVLELISRHQEFFKFAIYEGILDSDAVPKGSVFAKRSTAFEDRYPGMLQTNIEQGIAEGVVEPQDMQRIHRFISGALRGAVLAALVDPSLDPIEEGRFAAEMCLRALRPPAASQPTQGADKPPKGGSAG